MARVSGWFLSLRRSSKLVLLLVPKSSMASRTCRALSLSTEENRFKNDAAIRKTEASNQWNFYQAKSGKQNLSELGMQLVDETRRPGFEASIKRYVDEKAEIKLAAEKLEKESADFDAQSEAQMHQHHRWAQATTVLQIANAMAAIALLTKRRWLEKVVFGLSGLGLVVGTLAYFHV